ncbi:MAG: ORF6N domain-containing protein [Candidatus Nitrotoga sp.]|nr:ORF6N domain-containing protein [Candidatus Nitrotoga sp.]
MTTVSTLVAPGPITQRILLIQGHKAMTNADSANLNGVPTEALSQSVRRNLERFPSDFMFQLTAEAKQEVVTNCDHLAKLKFSSSLPNAFTEHGALMLGNVLKSSRAVEISLLVVRTFVQIREMLSTHKELATKLEELERKISSHDQAIAGLIDAIRQLMQVPAGSPRPIGFTADISKHRNK